jgi:benzoyl-CoA 2,3-dioxygenase component A
MREGSADLAQLVDDSNTYFYFRGLRAMEEGVILALRNIAESAGLSWSDIGRKMKERGRLHLETY